VSPELRKRGWPTAAAAPLSRQGLLELSLMRKALEPSTTRRAAMRATVGRRMRTLASGLRPKLMMSPECTGRQPASLEEEEEAAAEAAAALLPALSTRILPMRMASVAGRLTGK
jgi:hypothetical protein